VRNVVQKPARLCRSLTLLVVFPSQGLCLGRLDAASAAEHMRMPSQHLLANRRHDVLKREQLTFLGHPSMENDLKEQVAQFVFQGNPIAVLDGSSDLIGFL